jgi:N-acetylmuramoyl-L-alanine amidase
MLEAALICLALNVYFEARGEVLPGQYAVAHVTMNRAGGNPRKVCAEVAKPAQFSWTANRIVMVQGGWTLKKEEWPRDMRAWAVAKSVARDVLAGRIRDFTGGATHYHAHYVRPRWRHAFEVATVIGGHIFYRET